MKITVSIVCKLVPTILILLGLLTEVKYSTTMRKMYPEGRRKLARTGMRNKLFIFHCLNNKYLSHVVDNIIFGIRVHDYPIKLLRTCLYDNFRISTNFLLYIHINKIKLYKTNSKLSNLDSAYLFLSSFIFIKRD